MTEFNHATTVAFEVISNKEDGSDITGDMLIEALENRLNKLKLEGEEAIKEAMLDIYDTYEVES